MPTSLTTRCRLNSKKAFARIEKASDPVLAQVQAWMSAKDAQDALILGWQEAEHLLSLRIKPMKLGLADAARGDLPEARAMRSMMRRIQAADRALSRSAAQITQMQSTTSLGALAKIEMALRIQGPSQFEECSFALMDSGAKQLRALLAEA